MNALELILKNSDSLVSYYETATYSPCGRCQGYGVFSKYIHVKKGVCFKCLGSKVEPKNKSAKFFRKLSYAYMQANRVFADENYNNKNMQNLLDLINEIPQKYKGKQ